MPENEKTEIQLCQGMKNMIRVPLRNMDQESARPIAGIDAYVMWSDEGISIRFDGYGEKTSEDGQGWPIHIEIAKGVPTIHLWDDINEEEPMALDLEYAKESLRKED